MERGICVCHVGIVDDEADQEYAAGFNLDTARLGDFYPADDVLAEIGRVIMAAARLDRELPLILVAVKYNEPFDVLLTWQSGRLCKEIRKGLERLFEGDLLEYSRAAVDVAARRLESVTRSCTACGSPIRATPCSRYRFSWA